MGEPSGEPLQTAYAKAWADEFMRLFGDRKQEIDHGLMIGWFANAIMRGRDENIREAVEQLPPLRSEVERLKLTLDVVLEEAVWAMRYVVECERAKAAGEEDRHYRPDDFVKALYFLHSDIVRGWRRGAWSKKSL